MPRIGYALCGSFCTFAENLEMMRTLRQQGYDLLPILSYHAATLDTRFGKAADHCREIEEICGRPPITTIQGAEPIGPKRLCDLLLISPCTGNTLSKLALSIVDTPVTMAAKSHLRNGAPVLVAVSTNDALSGCAKSIGKLLNTRHYFFVPMGQDNPQAKQTSVVADFAKIPEAITAALAGKQLSPLLLPPRT